MLLQLHVLEPRLYSCMFCFVYMDMDMAFCFFPLVGFARFGCGSCGFWFGLDGLDDPVWYLVYCFVLFCFACSTFLLRVGYLILLLFGMVAALLLFLTM